MSNFPTIEDVIGFLASVMSGDSLAPQDENGPSVEQRIKAANMLLGKLQTMQKDTSDAENAYVITPEQAQALREAMLRKLDSLSSTRKTKKHPKPVKPKGTSAPTS